MGPLNIEKGYDDEGNPGAWVALDPGAKPVFVAPHHWIGVDLDGTLSRDDEEFVGVDGQRDRLEGTDAAKALGKVFQREEGRGRWVC